MSNMTDQLAVALHKAGWRRAARRLRGNPHRRTIRDEHFTIDVVEVHEAGLSPMLVARTTIPSGEVKVICDSEGSLIYHKPSRKQVSAARAVVAAEAKPRVHWTMRLDASTIENLGRVKPKGMPTRTYAAKVLEEHCNAMLGVEQ